MLLRQSTNQCRCCHCNVELDGSSSSPAYSSSVQLLFRIKVIDGACGRRSSPPAHRGPARRRCSMPICASCTCSGDAGSMPQLKPSTPLDRAPAACSLLAFSGAVASTVGLLRARLQKRPAAKPSPAPSKHGPVRRARALKAGMHHVLRPVRLVGLRNQAAALVQRCLRSARANRETSSPADDESDKATTGRRTVTCP